MSKVFISYAGADRDAAFRVCEGLEAAGLSCWIAPRNVPAGQPYASAIVRAIQGCRLLLLLYSRESNRSEMVLRELENAASAKRPLLPVRLEDVAPSDEMRFYVGREQWLDGGVSDDAAIRRVVEAVRAILDSGTGSDVGGDGNRSADKPTKGAKRSVGSLMLACVALVTIAGMALVFTLRKGVGEGVAPRMSGEIDAAAGTSGGSTRRGASDAELSDLVGAIKSRVNLRQLRVRSLTAGKLAAVSGPVTREDELVMIRERLADLADRVKFEVVVDPAGVRAELIAEVKKLGVEGVDVKMSGRLNEPVREVILRYKANQVVSRESVQEVGRELFMRPELLKVVEDP